MGLMGGSAGLLKAGKGMTWERWHAANLVFFLGHPLNIKPAVVTRIGHQTMDLSPPFSAPWPV